MYRIGELAKLADVTPDTIRYYEKQQMMDHDVRTEGDFVFTRITIFSVCALFVMPDNWVSPRSDPRIIVDPHRSGASYLSGVERDRSGAIK